MKQLLLVLALLGVLAGSIHYKRESARNADYTDPYRYDRMSHVGISVDYRKEPLVAWKIISGPRRLELTGGGKVDACMDEHLLLGHPFATTRTPANIGEALDFCRRVAAR
jgi:hypothetical protein